MRDIKITMRREYSTIIDFLRQMKNRESVRLLESASQFNFDRGVILDFLDSVINRHEVHIVLVNYWYKKIKSRPFAKNYMSEGNPHNWSSEQPYGTTYVLDGHRRLQSLYSAFFGSFDGERIFYDLSAIGNAKRFSFSKKQKSTISLVRMDKVFSFVKRTLVNNWLFDTYNQNIHRFYNVFKSSRQLNITSINIREEDVANTGSAENMPIPAWEYQNKLDVFLDMLNNPTEASYFREICNRLRLFVELVQNSEQ